MSFQIEALPAEIFRDDFQLSEAELAAKGACIVTAKSDNGYPCRVSLSDAKKGEKLLLTHFEHQEANTPYRASHAIYVRKNASQSRPDIGEVPAALAARLLSVRGFDSKHFMQRAEVVDGYAVAGTIAEMFADKSITYLHLHNAKPGCFAAKVVRPTNG